MVIVDRRWACMMQWKKILSEVHNTCAVWWWYCCCFCQTVIQYIPRNMHTVFALLCFVVVIHWPIFPYPSGLLHWHCGNLTIAPVPAKQPWWIWINTSCEFIMNDCITTTKQSTTKPCAYFLGYTVFITWDGSSFVSNKIISGYKDSHYKYMTWASRTFQCGQKRVLFIWNPFLNIVS